MNKFLIALLALGFAGTVHAAGLKEKKMMKEWETELATEAKTVTEKCGFTVATTMDPKFSTSDFVKENTNAASFCKAALGMMWYSLCADADTKAALKEKIKKLHCVPAKGNTQSYALKGGTLTVTVGPSASNLDSTTKEWLENNL